MKPLWYNRLPWDMIRDFSKRFDVPEKLVAAVIMGESSGFQYSMRIEPLHKFKFQVERFAKLHQGGDTYSETLLQNSSYGYMHILAVTARSMFGYEGPCPGLIAPDMSLQYGCRYLKYQLNRYKNSIEDAVAAYNAGTVTKNMNGTYANQDYVSKVMRYYMELNDSE